MHRLLLALVFLGFSHFGLAQLAEGSHHNCSDYPSQAAAQAALRADPSDPSGPDRDRDGIGCESRPCPCDRTPVDRSGAGAAMPAPTPVPVVDQGEYATHQPVPARVPDGWAMVTRVIDGDTIDVQLWDTGLTERIRVIGIDTPETSDPRTGVECFGREASATARDWLTSQWVWLEADLSQDERDRYGRLLRYLWLEDPTFGWWDFGYWMIADGYAYEYTFRTAYQYQAEYRAAEAAAWSAGAGLWAAETCAGVR